MVPYGVEDARLLAGAVLQAGDGDVMGTLLIVEVVHRVCEGVNLRGEALSVSCHLLH